ncbi:hypothetical protein [Armatimonas sp.]|uniref:hypothetical protein n=1 Tax=Armatimonas sp. TaxID=1872638 RepID=UPI00374D99CE
MIRITKTVSWPEKLALDGVDEMLRLCTRYESGEREFEFDKNLYGHASVKIALVEDQHGKCCFCERIVGSDSDVEHFRPKRAVCQESERDMLKPGYYWLAYDWENLFLCCRSCNQRFKRSYFPLQDKDRRARSHADDLTQESPLFIHPEHDDPEQLIGWHNEVPYAIGDNEKALHTLEALRLRKEDRPPHLPGDLQSLRRDHLINELQMLYYCLQIAQSHPDPQLAEDLRSKLIRMQAPTAPFAAMTRAFCAARGIA